MVLFPAPPCPPHLQSLSQCPRPGASGRTACAQSCSSCTLRATAQSPPSGAPSGTPGWRPWPPPRPATGPCPRRPVGSNRARGARGTVALPAVPQLLSSAGGRKVVMPKWRKAAKRHREYSAVWRAEGRGGAKAGPPQPAGRARAQHSSRGSMAATARVWATQRHTGIALDATDAIDPRVLEWP